MLRAKGVCPLLQYPQHVVVSATMEYAILSMEFSAKLTMKLVPEEFTAKFSI